MVRVVLFCHSLRSIISNVANYYSDAHKHNEILLEAHKNHFTRLIFHSLKMFWQNFPISIIAIPKASKLVSSQAAIND